MATLLPSYEDAISRDPWPLILPKLWRNQLVTGSRVCKAWWTHCSRALWSDPANNFDNEEAAIAGLVTFFASLPRARHQVKALTNTLHLPQAHVEAYGSLEDDWLRLAFEHLPNLKILKVRELNFFEHTALYKLQHARPTPGVSRVAQFGLRYLDASGCAYLSSESLQKALGQLTSLVFLDLSRVHAAIVGGNSSPLHELRKLPYLKVLRLCGVRLKDAHMAVLASSVQRKLKCLDVRDNYLTDNAIKSLCDECVGAAPREIESRFSGPFSQHTIFNQYGASLELSLVKYLADPHNEPSVLRNASPPGLTHLSISGNEDISGSAVVQLLSMRSLAHLDASVHVDTSESQMASQVEARDYALQHLRIPLSLLSLQQFESMQSLQTLDLTDIPTKSAGPAVAGSLAALLTAAGHRASTAREHVRIHNALPPGRRTLAGLKAQALQSFPLRKIVLEVITQPRQKVAVEQTLASPAGDADSEAFYAASSKDFSFFDPEDTWPAIREVAARPTLSRVNTVDTIAHIKDLRKRQRTRFEAQEAAFVFSSDADPKWVPEAYWDGEVSVVRN